MKNNFGRNLLKRSDILVIFLTLLLIFSTFLVNRVSPHSETIAIVTVKGKTERQIDLSSCENCIIMLETKPQVTLEINDGKIRFTNSLCPDGTCEKSGFLSKVGDTAACLPAKTVVTIKGTDKSEIDALVG